MTSDNEVVLKIELIRAATAVLNGPLDSTSEPYKAAKAFLIDAWDEFSGNWHQDDEVRTVGTVVGPAVLSKERPEWGSKDPVPMCPEEGR